MSKNILKKNYRNRNSLSLTQFIKKNPEAVVQRHNLKILRVRRKTSELDSPFKGPKVFSNEFCKIFLKNLIIKMMFILIQLHNNKHNQLYCSSSNISTDTAVIVKDQMLNEKFTFCLKFLSLKWNLTKSQATRLKSAKYKTHVIKEQL